MTITVDLATEAIRTGTGSPTTGSHGGAASGVVGVVIALMHGASSTDHISAVSYGGVALARQQRNVDTNTEQGAAELWFLGAGVPQGTQTWSYTSGATTDDIDCRVITLKAATSVLKVQSVGGIDENTANPSVALTTGGKSGMAFAAMYSGLTAESSLTAGANCTKVGSGELSGNFCSTVVRQTTGGTADFTIAVTSSTDDVAFAAMMVVEEPPISLSVTQASFQPDGQTTVENIGLVTSKADIQPAGQTVAGEATSSVDPATFDIDGQSISLTISTPLAVDAAAFQIDGQAITLTWTQNWFLAVDTASFQIDGQSAPLNVGLVVDKADIQPTGQDITLTWAMGGSDTPITVDSAAFQIGGQDVGLQLTWSVPVDAAAFQPVGQDITLTLSNILSIFVDSAAFSIVGSGIDLVTTGQEQLSGGIPESQYEKQYDRFLKKLKKELEEEQERAELADRLEKVLVQEGSLSQAQADLIRLRGIASQYRSNLPNRARRALAFAERAQSEFSTQLALKELQKAQEEEELAVLLLMALD